MPTAVLRAVAGPTLAALLLAGGGGVLTGVVTECAGTGELSAAWPLDPRGRGAVSSVATLAGGLGLLGLGSLVVAGLAAFFGQPRPLCDHAHRWQRCVPVCRTHAAI